MNRDPLPGTKYRARDYTALPLTSSSAPSHKHNSPERNIPKRKRVWIVSILFLFILLLLATSYIHFSQKPNSNLLKQELSQAQKNNNFPIYAPSSVPAGYFYKKGSISVSRGVVIYQLNSGANKNISISEQPVPEKVAMDDFYKRFLSNKVNAISTEGKAIIGTQGKQVVGSLETKNTWVLINAGPNVDEQVLSEIINTLKHID
jgi:hypothetical protein